MSGEWPEGWTAVICHACGQMIGGYLTTHPFDVMDFPCPCGISNFVEPAVRR